MYKFYMDGVRLPLAPSKMTTTISNKDEDIDLMNGEVMTVLNKPGLTEFEFEFILPSYDIKTAEYDDGFLPPEYFMSKLELLKQSQKPFQFIIIRSNSKSIDSLSTFLDTNITVSLVEYEITEDAGTYGRHKLISVTLKQYKTYNTIIDCEISIDDMTGAATGIVNLINERPTYDQHIYLDRDYITKGGETYASLSFDWYDTMDYAEAIAEFNDYDYHTNELSAGIGFNIPKLADVQAKQKEIDEENYSKQQKEIPNIDLLGGRTARGRNLNLPGPVDSFVRGVQKALGILHDDENGDYYYGENGEIHYI